MKIGIIGAGSAGLVAAWLLEQQHDVIVFEKSDRVGGHCHTIYVEQNGDAIPVEIGFEFFTEHMYPAFWRLLSLLNVEVQPYKLTHTFYDYDQTTFFSLPPVQTGTFFWSTLRSPRKMAYIAQLLYVIERGKTILRTANTDITIAEFLDKISVTKSFKEQFFYPFFCAAWALPAQEIKSFAACVVLEWIIQNKNMSVPWYEIVKGTTAYIHTLVNELRNTIIKKSSDIVDIHRQDHQYVIVEQTGHTTHVDHVICATEGYQARKLLNNIPEVTDLCAALDLIEYFSATLCVHADARFMPRTKHYWSVSNVCTHNGYSALTTYKPFKNGSPLFRSWLLPGFPDPEHVYAQEVFYHARLNPNYFKAQKHIELLQGAHHVWLAGLYTNGVDSHESAVKSAINIATKLAPDGERLHALLI